MNGVIYAFCGTTILLVLVGFFGTLHESIRLTNRIATIFDFYAYKYCYNMHESQI